MRYAIVVYESQAGLEARSDPEYRGAYAAYVKALAEERVPRGLQDALPKHRTARPHRPIRPRDAGLARHQTPH